MLRKGALLFVLGLLVCLPLQAQDLGLDALLARHFDALGGIDMIRGIETMRGTGRMTVGPGMEAAFTRYSKRPNKVRLEIDIQGMKGIQAFDGELAWWFMPFMGHTAPEPMPADMVDAMLQEADMDGPLVDHEAKGNQLELLGMQDGAYVLQVTLQAGDVQFYHIDPETFLLTKVTGSMQMQGMDLDFETRFSDYREVSGMMVPHHIDMSGLQGPGSTGVMIIESVEANVEIDDSLFSMQQQ